MPTRAPYQADLLFHPGNEMSIIHNHRYQLPSSYVNPCNPFISPTPFCPGTPIFAPPLPFTFAFPFTFGYPPPTGPPFICPLIAGLLTAAGAPVNPPVGLCALANQLAIS